MGLSAIRISQTLAVITLRTSLTLTVFGLFWFTLGAFQTTPVHAAAGINKTLNYQGRLLTNTGAVVPDGNYNMRFKVYQDGDGCVPGGSVSSPCGGTIKWTEKYENQTGGGQGVVVKNGYFSVALGTYCAFSGGSCQGNTNTAVDWNQDTLWLSMDVGGTATGSPTYNGELLPMRRMGSAVYALNAGLLGGLASSAFAQLGANQTFTGTNTFQPTSNIPSVVIKQTSAASPTADIFDLQTANGTAILQATGPAANESAVTLQSVGATRALTLTSQAAATWSTVSGILTLTGAGGVTLSTGSNTNIALSPNGSGDVVISQGAGSGVQITATAASTVDQLAVSNSGQASTTSGVDGISVTFGSSNASGDALHVSPSYTGGATDTLTFNAIETDAFTATNAAGTDTVNGISLGALTEAGAGAIVSTALKIGSGWDNALTVNGVGVINGSGIVQAAAGGTGQSSYAVGDLLYANTTSTLAKLADVATGSCLVSGGVGVAPSWGACGVAADNITVNSTAATDANFLNTTNTGTIAGVTFAINTVSNPDDITVTISNATATLAGVVTNTTQTFGGDKSFNGITTLQNTTNATSAIIKQTSVASPTADIFNLQTANATNILQATGPAANESAVTLQSVGATRALTLTSQAAATWSTVSGSLTLSGAGGLALNTASNNGISLTPNGSGDITSTLGNGGQFAINATPTADTAQDSVKISLNPTVTGSTAVLQGVLISQADNANTGVYDSLLKLENLKTPETTANGLFIEQNAASGTLSNGVQITNTAGSITNAINLTGTFTNLLQAPNFTLNNAGQITSGTWQGAAVGATFGGTGQTSYAVGDLLFANTTTTLSKLSDVATGSCLVSGGVNTAPSWGACGVAADNITVNSSAATDANFLNTTNTGTVAGVTWALNTVSNPDDITATISNATSTLAGVVTNTTQSFGGDKTFTGITTLQNTTNATSAIVKQSSVGSPTADIFNVQTANSTNIIQVTGPTANESAVTVQSVGATRALTLTSQAAATWSTASGLLTLTGAGGLTVNTASNNSINLSPNGSGDVVSTLGNDGQFLINATPTADTAQNSVKINLNPTVTGSTAVLQGLLISQADNANTGVYDSLLKLENLKTPETTANGLFIEQNAASGTLSNGIQITNTAGAITNAINLTGTYTNLLQAPNFVVNNAGQITSGTWQGTAVGATFGGTGQTSYTVGDLLFANTTTTLGKLSDVSLGSCLISGGVGNFPSWGACGSADSISVNSTSATDANFLNTTNTGTAAGVTWAVNTASNPDDITATISNATAALAGVVTNTTQSFGGDKTFTGNTTFQPTTNTFSALVKQTSVGSPTADILDVQTVNATNIIQVTGPAINESAVTIQSVGATRALTLTSQAAATWGTASGLLTVSGNGGITMTTATGSNITVGTTSQTGSLILGQSTATNTITIGNANTIAGATQSINIGAGTGVTSGKSVVVVGSTANASTATIQGGTGSTAINLSPADAGGINIGTGTQTGTITVGQSTGSNTINIGTANTAATFTQTINVGTGTGVTSGKAVVTIGSTANASATTIQGGTGDVNVSAVGTAADINLTTNSSTSSITAKSSTNSATAFRVQNAGSVAQLTVDTSNARVYVGPTAGDTVGTLLVLGNKTTSGDPTGVEGGMYYNSSTDDFRCFRNGGWQSCQAHSASMGGLVTGPNTIQSTTYVNLTAPSSLSYTKLGGANTNLVVNISMTMYATVAVLGAQVGVNIDSTDYDCGYLFFSQLSVKGTISCSIVVPSLTSGAKTIQMRWKRLSGTGSLNQSTGADYNNMSVIETN